MEESRFYKHAVLTGLKRVFWRVQGLCLKPGAVGNSAYQQNVSTNAAETPEQKPPTGLRSVRSRFSIQIPSRRDSRGFWNLQGFCVKSGAVDEV